MFSVLRSPPKLKSGKSKWSGIDLATPVTQATPSMPLKERHASHGHTADPLHLSPLVLNDDGREAGGAPMAGPARGVPGGGLERGGGGGGSGSFPGQPGGRSPHSPPRSHSHSFPLPSSHSQWGKPWGLLRVLQVSGGAVAGVTVCVLTLLSIFLPGE